MVRSEAEYQEALSRLEEERRRLDEHRARLTGLGLNDEELKPALDPLGSFHLQLEEDVQSYERLKRGDIEELLNLHGFGCGASSSSRSSPTIRATNSSLPAPDHETAGVEDGA